MSWAGAGGVLKGQVEQSGNLIPALGWKISDKNLEIRDLCGITVSLLPFWQNLCTSKLVKSDFISTRAVFQTALWSFASSNIRDSQLPPSIISIPSPGPNTCERPIKPFNTQNLLLLIFSVCSICCSVCP